ncbi:hypothetical protein JZX82_gp30 [Gordonia phage William]|uniref:Uncharacterized protein n=1 Tax=Gordonia phage William TaxID=2571253 RepID=A0A4Y6EGI5_9CAUD|nr:hypothetical protein JZX82_gp30 [Gordonia phage William]QDF17125.1 hypothetical protein SEA_WILLIAM_30 [Gordonia phage William]
MIEPSNLAHFYAAGEGTYWWHDAATDAYLITDTFEPPTDDALYLMPWDGPWFAQWDENWTAAAAQLNSVIARHEEAED